MCDEGRGRQYLLDEYKEVGINWRYWGEVRFKQLTVFLTATGVLGAAVFSRTLDSAEYAFVRLLLAVLGLSISMLFFLLEERATYYRRAYMSCAMALEETSGTLTQYRRTQNPWPVRSDTIFRFFFATIAALWITYAAFVTWPTPWSAAAGLSAVALYLLGWCVAEGYRKQAPQAGTRPLPNASAPPAPLPASRLDVPSDSNCGRDQPEHAHHTKTEHQGNA